MLSLRKTISNIYRRSSLAHIIMKPFYSIYAFGLKLLPDKYIISHSFKRHMGYPLNLDNPKTLNEKINWLKLYNRKEVHTTIADKYKVRTYIREKVGKSYLIPLMYHTKNVKEIVPENMPDKAFIIKTNHNSAGGIIVRDKTKEEWRNIRAIIKKWMGESHYNTTSEWQYKNIERRIIVEELLTKEDDSIPEDYKFHCFNGKLAFIMVDIDRHSNNRTRNLYDKDWNLLPCEWGRPNGRYMEKPSNLAEMIDIAETIAQDFINIRVDLYSVKGSTYFGELTLHHASGFQKFYDHECDLKFGQQLKIATDNE